MRARHELSTGRGLTRRLLSGTFRAPFSLHTPYLPPYGPCTSLLTAHAPFPSFSYAHESVDSIHELLGCLYESSGGSEGRSAQVVLGHLTENAKKLFKLLLKYTPTLAASLAPPLARRLTPRSLFLLLPASFFAPPNLPSLP